MRSTPKALPPRFLRADVDEFLADWQKECGNRITARRKVFGLHRRELANLCDTTEATIVRIESGTLNPKDGLRLLISAVLRCEVADLWRYPLCERINDLALDVA